jgi:hypothetical protein
MNLYVTRVRLQLCTVDKRLLWVGSGRCANRTSDSWSREKYADYPTLAYAAAWCLSLPERDTANTAGKSGSFSVWRRKSRLLLTDWRRGIDSNCRYGLTRQGFECWRQIRLGQLTEKANAPASELTSRPRRALLVDGSEGRVSDCHWPRVSMWPAMTALGRRQAVRNTSGIDLTHVLWTR